MQDYDQGIVLLPPLDGTPCPRPAFVAASQNEFEESLDSDEGDREDEDRHRAQRVRPAAACRGLDPLRLSPTAGRKHAVEVLSLTTEVNTGRGRARRRSPVPGPRWSRTLHSPPGSPRGIAPGRTVRRRSTCSRSSSVSPRRDPAHRARGRASPRRLQVPWYRRGARRNAGGPPG